MPHSRLREDEQAAEQVEVRSNTKGYIARQQDEIEKQLRNENTLLPATLDYRQVSGLSNEVIAKLNDRKPASIGGHRVSPALRQQPYSILVWLKRNKVCCVVALINAIWRGASLAALQIVGPISSASGI